MPRERSVFVKKLYNEVHLPEKKKRRCDDGDDIFNNLNSDSDDDITDLLWRRKQPISTINLIEFMLI